AGADLEHVGVLTDEFDLAGVHDFGDDGQAGFGADLGEHLEGGESEALEGVGGGTGLEGAAAEHAGAGFADGVGGLPEHLPAFDRAGPGDDRQLTAAYHRADPVAHPDLAVLTYELP